MYTYGENRLATPKDEEKKKSSLEDCCCRNRDGKGRHQERKSFGLITSSRHNNTIMGLCCAECIANWSAVGVLPSNLIE